MNEYEILNILKEFGLVPNKIGISIANNTYVSEQDNLYILKRSINYKRVVSIIKKFDLPIVIPIIKNDWYLIKVEFTNDFSIKQIINTLETIRDKTKYTMYVKKRHVDNFYKIYKILDFRFKQLEYQVRSFEVSAIKGDYIWTVLSRYYIILEVKKKMYEIQKKIMETLKSDSEIEISLVNIYYKNNYSKGKFIDYEKSFLGISCFDLIFLYVENIDLKENWEVIIKDYLKGYKSYYLLFFKFMVYYILVLNINTKDLKNYESLSGYIRITNSLKRTLTLFKKL